MVETKRYDPVKRREYYLRTRELKGRSKGLTRFTKKGRGSDEIRKDEKVQAKTKDAEVIAGIVGELRNLMTQGKEDTPEYTTKFKQYTKAIKAFHDKYAEPK